jgi:cellulose synthase/poly-beta-1,6-N-acetylglucosamine synthase-like glycosyltransferase
MEELTSVVLSTYNRASILPWALDALVAQPGHFELVVVDNNSTDATSEVVRRYAVEYPGRVRHVFEARQGLSFARNAGIERARGAIIAFTDDDVRVAPDWTEQVRRAFDRHTGASYISGRILPQWTETPPRWLTDAHWSPLALQDYGDAPMRVSASWPICLVGASLAFRRDVFDRVGLFTPSFGRIRDGIGSTEDHELQLRVWMAGLEGVYVPGVVSTATIPPERMRKRYHKRWHRGHGRHCARMRLRNVVHRDWAPLQSTDDLVTLFGAPAFVYAEIPKMMRNWILAVVRRRDPFFCSNKVRHLVSYIGESWKMDRATRRESAVRHVARFVEAYARKTARRIPAAGAR